MTSETRPQPLSIARTATLAPGRAEAPRGTPSEPRATVVDPIVVSDAAASRAAPILEARDVTKRYELGKTTVEALRGVTMAVAPGEFVALMGPSGSGKSTLLQLLGGLDQPTTGSIVFEGADISHLSDAQATKLRRERTGFVFQAFNLIPLLNVRENIELPFTIAGGQRDARDRVRQAMEMVELTGKEDHRPDQLSAGEQQRVAVARALVTRPSVLLADEPTGNLDYTNSGELLDALWRSSEQVGQTIVLVTHDARAAAYADRVLVIGDGRIEEEIDLGRRADHSAAPLIARLAKVGL
jgi:putative ABC transport system ATP-binding protein